LIQNKRKLARRNRNVPTSVKVQNVNQIPTNVIKLRTNPENETNDKS